jgi:L-ascorbate metabolism protein UlaG (beta-lactamase superfamily)
MIIYNTGHSTVQIKTRDLVIWIDPFSFESTMEKADVILVTHAHYDHFDKKKIRGISTPKTIIVHHECDCDGVNIAPGETRTVKGAVIEAVPAYNINKQFHPKNLGVGYVVEVEGKRVYHAGDTDMIPEMKDLRNIDLACLPIGGTYTMDEAEAAQAARVIRPRAVMPIHYDSIAKGDPQKFRGLVEGIGVTVYIQKAEL